MKNLTDNECKELLKSIFSYTDTDLKYANYAALISIIQNFIQEKLIKTS